MGLKRRHTTLESIVSDDEHIERPHCKAEEIDDIKRMPNYFEKEGLYVT